MIRILQILRTRRGVTPIARFSTHTDHNDLVQKSFTNQVSMIDGKQGPSPYWAENADWVVHKFSTLPFVGHRLGSKSVAQSIPGLTVLEVACGTGMLSRRIAKKFPLAQVSAIDFTQAMLVKGQELAKEEGIFDRINYKLGNVYELPFPNETFDVCLGRWFLHHLLDPGSAIEEIHRILKKGGFFINVDIVPPEDKTVANRMNELEKLRDPSHVSFLSRTTLDSILQQFQYSIIERTQSMDLREVSQWTNMARTTDEAKKKIIESFEKELSSPGDPNLVSGFEPYRKELSPSISFTFQCVYTAAQKLQ